MKCQSVLYVLLFVLLLGSCGQVTAFKGRQAFEDQSWGFADSVSFNVAITDTLKTYDLMVDLEHSSDYSFQNCYLYVSTLLPSGQWLGKRVNIDMADKTGKWYSECGGHKCKLEIALQSNAFFNQPGDHQFTFKQFMREDPLQGIRAIGFRVLETGQTR